MGQVYPVNGGLSIVIGQRRRVVEHIDRDILELDRLEIEVLVVVFVQLGGVEVV